MHGDEPATIGKRIRDMKERREKKGLPPMQYGLPPIVSSGIMTPL